MSGGKSFQVVEATIADIHEAYSSGSLTAVRAFHRSEGRAPHQHVLDVRPVDCRSGRVYAQQLAGRYYPPRPPLR
jgi:hypothetical protein